MIKRRKLYEIAYTGKTTSITLAATTFKAALALSEQMNPNRTIRQIRETSAAYGGTLWIDFPD